MIELIAAYILGLVTGILAVAGYIYYKYRKQIKKMNQLTGLLDP